MGTRSSYAAILLLGAGLLAFEWAHRRELEFVNQHVRDLQEEGAVLRSALRAPESRAWTKPSPGMSHVVFLGDSITELWELNRYFSGRSLRPLNRGIGGNRTRDILARFSGDAIELEPRSLLILAGTNDILQGVDPQTIIGNLEIMIQRARRRRIPLFLGTLPPIYEPVENGSAKVLVSAAHQNALKQVNLWIRRHCIGNGCVAVDFYRVLSGPTGGFDSSLFKDGVHPSERGYTLMARLVMSALPGL